MQHIKLTTQHMHTAWHLPSAGRTCDPLHTHAVVWAEQHPAFHEQGRKIKYLLQLILFQPLSLSKHLDALLVPQLFLRRRKYVQLLHEEGAARLDELVLEWLIQRNQPFTGMQAPGRDN